MNILITGASGYLGRIICKELELSGHNIILGLRKQVKSNDYKVDFSNSVFTNNFNQKKKGLYLKISIIIILQMT